jgi:Zn-dependent peptidase ImmA (M78 family)
MNYTLTPLEAEIKRLYLSWGMCQPEQIDLFGIAEKLDIWIYVTDFESQAIEREEGLFSLNLDKNKSLQEQWEDFGHEIAHILNHGGNQLDMSEGFADFQETKANNFALQFCVPTFMLLDSILPSNRKETILYIMETFNVTEHFARKKLIHFERQVIGFQFHEEFTQALKVSEAFSQYIYNGKI